MYNKIGRLIDSLKEEIDELFKETVIEYLLVDSDFNYLGDDGKSLKFISKDGKSLVVWYRKKRNHTEIIRMCYDGEELLELD